MVDVITSGRKHIVASLKDARTKNVPSGQILIYEGDTGPDVYVLKSGVIKIYDIDEHGNEKILHLVQSPRLVPFTFFSDDETALKWFYATVTDCELWVCTTDQLKEMMKEDDQLSSTLVENFSVDTDELLVRLSSLGRTNSTEKVIAALLFLFEKFSHEPKTKTPWRPISFPVSHQLIADLCGLTRESTALAIKRLERKELLRYPKATVLELKEDFPELVA